MILWALFVIMLFVPVFIDSRYVLHILIVTLIFLIIGVGMNLFLGYMGYLSIANNAFMGIGAYFSALFVIHTGVSFWISLPVTILVCLFVGFLTGVIPLAYRNVKGTYFALFSAAIGLVIQIIFNNWVDVTRGPMGLTGVPNPDSILGIDFSERTVFFYLILFFAALSYFIIYKLVNSSFGRILRSIKVDEDLCSSIGINLSYNKTLCWVINAGFAGMAGTFFAHYQNLVSPDMFEFYDAVDMVSMVIIGGMGTILGPVVGALVVFGLPEFIGIPEYRTIIFATILMIILATMPEGIVGVIEKKIRERKGRTEEAIEEESKDNSSNN